MMRSGRAFESALFSNVYGRYDATRQVSRRTRSGPAYASNPMLDIEFSELSDLGRRAITTKIIWATSLPPRRTGARTHGWLFALADGVGGHEQGEVASQGRSRESACRLSRGSPGRTALHRCCRAWCRKPISSVYETRRQAPAPGGTAMATTVVACALRYDRAVVAHVGDSRCYLIRHGKLGSSPAITPSLASRCGWVSFPRKEAAELRHRHLLSRSLGADLFVNVEIGEHQVLAGRRAAAVFRRPASIRWRLRKWQRCAGQWRRSERRGERLWSLPMNGTAAIISAFS